MSMDLTGKGPKNDAGREFSATAFWWIPLVSIMHEADPRDIRPVPLLVAERRPGNGDDGRPDIGAEASGDRGARRRGTLGPGTPEESGEKRRKRPGARCQLTGRSG